MDIGNTIKTSAGTRNLKYINDTILGITGRRVKSGFTYYDPNGVKISNENIILRINNLAIPPAWENVWICPYTNGHIQVTGVDDKKRKQYIYHEAWLEMQKQNKFDKVTFFGKSLPKIRGRIRRDLNSRGLGKHKVVATVVWLLEHTFIRVGNDEYAKENNSFGLTTLRNKHVKVRGSTVHFEFTGKSGVHHLVDITHPKIKKVIKRCIELPGYELFQCVDDETGKHAIDSSDVNEYLQDTTGEDISAKDFRTWGGTFLSAITLNKMGYPKDKVKMQENVTTAVKEVAKHLRNTPSVCKSYYIHPTVLKTYEDKKLIAHFENLRAKPRRDLTRDELALIKLLAN